MMQKMKKKKESGRNSFYNINYFLWARQGNAEQVPYTINRKRK